MYDLSFKTIVPMSGGHETEHILYTYLINNT